MVSSSTSKRVKTWCLWPWAPAWRLCDPRCATFSNANTILANQWFCTAINNDRAEAINDAKATTAFYASMGQYEPFFAAHGFEKEARACQEAMLAKDLAGFVGAITDEMAQTFVMAGTPDDIRKRVEEVWDTCDSFCLVPPMAGLEPEKMLFYIGTIAETFYG